MSGKQTGGMQQLPLSLAQLSMPEIQLPDNAGTIEVLGITADSRQVKPGYLFAALSGSTADGAKFIDDAVTNGAVAILADKASDPGNLSVPLLRSDDPRRNLALMAARFHSDQPVTMVAVTGTAGKTSVASFLQQIWTHCGLPAAMIGTTGIVAPGRVEYGSLTTPDPVHLHQLLNELAGDGVSHCSMEASSHGLDQRRLDGVRLAAGGFTNLGRDHMDYHPTVEHYLGAKLRLFDTLLQPGQPAVIFADDDYSDAAIEAAKASGLKICSVGRKGNYIAIKRVEQERFRQIGELEFEGKIFRIVLPMAGEFQLANALVAAGLAISTGCAAEPVFDALAKLKGAPGRLELIGTNSNGSPAYVDYAHKPDALEKVLQALRPYTTGKLILVFGCGGDRDRGKRALMGEIAGRLADRVIVTDDNPRTEVAADVRAEILAAVPEAEEVGDRREAIFHGVKMLGEGDTLVVAGKGHEEGQIVGNETLPFSDHTVVQAALDASK